MPRKEPSEDLKRLISRTGSVSESLEKMKQKGYEDRQIEDSLKGLVFSGKKEELVQNTQARLSVRSFLRKFLVIAFSSAMTVLLFFAAGFK